MPEKWPGQSLESAKEKNNDLTEQEKLRICSVWNKAILGCEHDLSDIKNRTDEEIKKWMHESLMGEAGKLIKEWMLEPDGDIIENIKKEADLNRKSELELKYIKDCHKKVDNFVVKFEGQIKGTRWNSWPSMMRKNASFNCVGASLIGLSFLEKSGVESYWGNPVGHVINIVKLSNGEWWYVDFLNGEMNVRRIEPKIRTISSVEVFEIDDKNIDYRLIPIYPKEECGQSILGNIEQLKKEASASMIIEDENKKEALKFVNEFKAYVKDDLSEISEKIFGAKIVIDDSLEMRAERERINELHGFKDESYKFVESLPKEEMQMITDEAVENIKSIKEFFFGDAGKVRLSANLMKFLELYKQSLKGAMEKDREFYVEIVNRLLFKIEEYKKKDEK